MEKKAKKDGDKIADVTEVAQRPLEQSMLEAEVIISIVVMRYS